MADKESDGSVAGEERETADCEDRGGAVDRAFLETAARSGAAFRDVAESESPTDRE